MDTHTHAGGGGWEWKDRVSFFRLNITHSKRQTFLLITLTMLGFSCGQMDMEASLTSLYLSSMPKDYLSSQASAGSNASHKLLSATAFPPGALAITTVTFTQHCGALQTSVLLGGEMPRDRWQLSWLKQRAAGSPFYKETLSTSGQKVGHNEYQVLPCE